MDQTNSESINSAPFIIYILICNHQDENALNLWGYPATFADISSLFARFCIRQLAALPWSDQAPSVETSVISKQLAQINELGFLTINSQPAVNGARSDDKVFGWGPGNGYVYQKVSFLDYQVMNSAY